MTEIIGVRFKPGGKHYFFAPGEWKVAPGQGVIVETARGEEYGECVKANTMVPKNTVVQPLRKVVRIASERDMEAIERGRAKEQDAFAVCQAKVEEHKLDMKLVDVEYSFEGNKILFFFTSEERVDFRALVRDLAAHFHARIEMRQIGVRDEARMLGGLGKCGKPFCCSSFLKEFQPVSIKMAKTQSLSLNPTKISGTCGRLMCCLKYEQGAYEDALRRSPKQESFVETPDGVGTVSSVNLLRETVKVRLDDSVEPPKHYRTSEIHVVRNGKGKRPEGYVPPPKAEMEARRYIPPREERDERPVELQNSLSAALEGILMPTTAQKPAHKQGAKSGQRQGQKPQGEGQSARRNRGGKEGQDAKRQERPKSSGPAHDGDMPGPAAQPDAEKKRNRRHWRPRGPRGGKKE